MKFGQLENLDNIDFSFPEIEEKYQFKNTQIPYSEVKFYFGAPIWGDKNFKGTLYPPKTPQKNFLIEYAKQFNSIEVNATRFGTPKLTTIQKWKDSVAEGRAEVSGVSSEDNFKFSIKIPQIVTHRKDMNCDASRYKFDEFCVALDLLGDNNGISYAVMPNYLKKDKFKDLQTFIERLPTDVPFAIELRDEGWFNEETVVDDWYYLFQENNIIPVLTDTPGRRDVLHLRLTNGQLFLRYVGDFSHRSDRQRIYKWVHQIRNWIDQGKVNSVWIYAHQPGEHREYIVDFFNTLINELNNDLNLDLKMLKTYY